MNDAVRDYCNVVRRARTAGPLAAALIVAATPSEAQNATALELEEVLVTARRYEEYLQDVPLSVTVLGDEQLRQAGIGNAAGLQMLTPSLVVTDQNNSRSLATYAIRGLSNGGDEITETSVTPYFSEVPTLAPKGSATLYDMGSVQVLKGPQGTLFGRTSTAGAVLLSPAHPEMGVFGGRVDVGFGDLGRREVSGVLNLPLGKQFAARVAVQRQQLDGYTKRLDGGRAFDERDVLSGRASITWRPNDTFNNYTLVQFDRFDGTAAGQVLAAYNTDPGFDFGFLPANVFQLFGVDGDFSAELDRVRNGGEDAVRRTAASPLNPVSEEGDSLMLVDIAQLDFELGESTLNVKNIFSYQRAGLVGGRDLDGTAVRWNDNVTGLLGDGAGGGSGTIRTDAGAATISSGRISVGPRVELYTEELQLSGSVSKDLLKWVAGGYYQRQPANTNIDGAFNTFYILDGAFSGGTYMENGFVVTGGEGWETGFYGQGTLDLSSWVLEGLHFTGGYRKSRNSQRATTRSTAGFDPVTGDLLLADDVQSTALRSEGDGWTIALDYKATDDIMLYVTTRKGYQPGGVNTVCDGVNCPATFGNETVRDVEIGAKFDFDVLGRPGRLNIAAYRMDYEDIQRGFGALDPNLTPVTFNDNVAEARLEGIEIDGQWQLTEGFNVSGFVSYNDARYTDYIGEDVLGVAQPGDPECHSSSPPGVCNLDLSDQPFPGNARYKAGLTLRYMLPFVKEDVGRISLAANAYYTDRLYFGEGARRVIDYLSGIGDARYTPEYVRDHVVSQEAYTLLNLRVDWEQIFDSNATASVFVRNVTDEVYATGAIPTFITYLGTATRSYGEPRTIGAQISYRFGDVR